MLPAPIPEDEADRLKSLVEMNILSTARDADLDRITRLTQEHFDLETALISLVDKDRQWFKSRVGLDAQESCRADSFCGHAINSDDMLIVENATKDDRFFDNPAVINAPHVRFYAGQSLHNPAGYRIGTLCVVSSQERRFDAKDQQSLKDFARLAELVLAQRNLSQSQNTLLRSLSHDQRDAMLDPLSGLWNQQGFDLFFKNEAERHYDNDNSFAVILVELDQAKHVCTEYGDELYNEVVKHAADVINQTTNTIDTVTRTEGASFALIVTDINRIQLPILGEKIRKALIKTDKFVLANGQKPFAASIGLTYVPAALRNDDLRNQAMDHAKKALNEARENGGNQFVLNNMSEEAVLSMP